MLTNKRALTRRDPKEPIGEDSMQEETLAMEKPIPGICPYCKVDFQPSLPLKVTTTYKGHGIHLRCLHLWRDGKPAPTTS